MFKKKKSGDTMLRNRMNPIDTRTKDTNGKLKNVHGQLYCFEAGSYSLGWPAACCVEDDFELLIPCLPLPWAPIKGVSSLVTH